MTGSAQLASGERVLLFDRKDRRYVITLAAGAEFHSHTGIVAHDAIIAAGEGGRVRTTGNAEYTIMRPTLSDFVVKMPRGAQVIYPKDLGAILMLADVSPGARVFESGVGSGALSMTLLRAGADVVGYEIREDFRNRAIGNIESFLGADAFDRYRVELRDAYDGIDESGFDRMVLDLPEPWQVAPHAVDAMRPGGILVAYTPSVAQVMQLRAALQRLPFTMIATLEVLHRGWYVEGEAVRPDHRMVAHTAFLTHARLLAGPGPERPVAAGDKSGH
ncbi:MAG: tRNA (adenine-N1)-methyltransferase [Acidimicrobiia bacterium]|nr:tRNA (adenine-N1)-methyltransferase [Acidimicrobiia bacterium]